MTDIARRTDTIHRLQVAVKAQLALFDAPDLDSQQAIVDYIAKHATAGLLTGMVAEHKAILDALIVAFAAVPSTDEAKSILVGYARGVVMLMVGRDALTPTAAAAFDELISTAQGTV
ncbi:hypothetical protein GURKE_00460 [Brevundimonas phage vB_BpoS-Gurke]|uniref:Uncharacterized protein n=1 Tax=Brevundimonas phage vB_BpoS-Gurke TaxID=2948599 RepID=A0A9E7N3B2_9CAUD|nr:hypothetical protein GURKE_00460 [Brevundimonas phage vB_BpoS-Gurke]